MVTYSVEASLRALIETRIPAVNTAGCHFSPVSGLTGESWRITGQNFQWLAREHSVAKRELGVNRQREQRILQQMSARALSPRVMIANQHWLVVEWLDGVVVEPQQFLQLADRGTLAELVARLHQAPRTGYPLNIHRQLLGYSERMDPSRRSADWLRLHKRFMAQKPPLPLNLVPLHMDIHPGNIIETNSGLRLIDWEYAADGDVALELAAMFRFNGWDNARQQAFLRQYGQQPGAYQDIAALTRQIARWSPWIDYLMLMWFEVRWKQTGEIGFLQWAAPLRRRFNLSGLDSSAG
ncbi:MULTISPECIES: thiamine kinase [Yersinia]|uniref:thiamine kinase n=1 Tax=Yersinia TaxID=629 RepID=UPI000EABF519|nr:thiamine kinase [Yersinia sp. IP36721]